MKKTWMYLSKILIILSVAVAGVVLLPQYNVYAAVGPVQVVAVEYYENQIIVLNNGNQKICFASEVEASKNKWEVIQADPGLYTMIDTSWLSSNVENILVIKGNEDITDTKSRVILTDKPLKLEISINYANMNELLDSESIAPMINIMTSVGTGANPIDFYDLEWKKGDDGQWQSTGNLTVGLLKKYLVKGTYLYFRIRAVDDVVTVTGIDFNDRREKGITGGFLAVNPTLAALGTNYPDGRNGLRFSNEVKLKIAKKSSAMVYGVDGSKFTVEMKYGKEYSVDGGSTWVQVTDRAVRYLTLSTILGDDTVDGLTDTTGFPEMTIYVRNYATTKSASSKITEINLNKQRVQDKVIVEGKAPADAIEKGDKNIYITYNGNKNMVLQIPTASSNLQYEYCVFKKNVDFDINKAVWSSVTKGTAVKIIASKAVDGGTLYIRKKEIKSRAGSDVDYELASTYLDYDINYPSIPEIVNATYTFTKTYSGNITFTVVLNAVDKLPFETTIKSIKLGAKTVNYVDPPVITTTAGVQTMTVTLLATSLETLPNCYGKAITIVYGNGTVDKTSIKLTIQSPTAAGTLTVTSAAATTSGTSFTMVTSKPAENTWKYVVTTTKITSVNTIDTIAKVAPSATINTITTGNSADNITITVGNYLTVFEVNAAGNIVKYNSVEITADKIK